MSGGTFNYEEHHLEDIARAIELELFKTCNWGPPVKPETKKYIRKIAKQLADLYTHVHNIDYFFAGDISENTLMQDIKTKTRRP
jgi:hypothetical protein